ncbi:hypothetical protein MD484_g8818, partial [Candolleomyces efflorescens]
MDDNEVLSRETESLKSQLRDKTRENATLNSQVVRLQEDVEGYRQDKKDLRSHIDDLKGDISALRQDLARERSENAKLQESIRELGTQLELALKRRVPALTSSKPDPESSIKLEPSPRNVVDRCVSAANRKKKDVTEKQRSPSLEILDPVVIRSSKVFKKASLASTAAALPLQTGGNSDSKQNHSSQPALSPSIASTEGLSDVNRCLKTYGKRKAAPESHGALAVEKGAPPIPVTQPSQAGTQGNGNLEFPVSSSKSSGKRKADSPIQSHPSKRVNKSSATADQSTPSCSSGAPSHSAPPNGDQLPTRPSVKVKAEAIILPPDAVAQYLHGAPHLPIDPAPSDLHVKRKFLREEYGGSDQQFVQYIQPTRNPSSKKKKRCLVFPMPNMNPAMPLVPGEPGLLFASRHEVLDGLWGVFRRHLNERDTEWLYLGEYESTLVGKMTKEQFCAQRPSVQRSWAKLLLSQKAFDCYVSMRARIALRKRGEIPVNEAADGDSYYACLVIQEMESIKQGRGKFLTEEDIIDAFTRGDEGIDIIRMQCVQYDRTFAQDIEERYYSRKKLEQDSEEDASKEQNSTNSTPTTSAVSSIKRKDGVGASTSILDTSGSSNALSPSSPTSSQPEPLHEDILPDFPERDSDGNVTEGGLSYIDSD